MAFAFDNIFSCGRIRLVFLVVTALAVQSCSIKKHLQPNQYLLTRNKVEIEKPFKKEYVADVEKQYKQKPNRKLAFLFNVRPYFYIKGTEGMEKKDTWWKRFRRETLGEPPVLVDTVFIEGTVKNMRNFLKTKGYYYPEITYTVKKKRNRHATVSYFVKPNIQYKVSDYDLHVDDKVIYDFLSERMKDSYIDLWEGFDQGKLIQEQERVINLLRNNGYYMMSKDYVDFDVDTANGNNFVKISLNVHNPEEFITHKQYYIKDLKIEIDKSATRENIGARDSTDTRSFLYIPNGYKLNPEIIDRNIFIKRGTMFRQNGLNRSYGRMTDLGIFRLINIQPRIYETRDSGFIMYNVRLVPSVKYDFTIEPQLLTSDQNNTLTNQSRNYGVAAQAQFNNRNIFHNAEILQVSLRGSLEVQGKYRSVGFFNSTEEVVTVGVIFPRTLFFPAFDRRVGFFSNKTSISVSGIYELNSDYTRQVITTGLNYQFNKRLITYTVAPIEVSFIKSEIVSDTLRNLRENNIFLQTLFANNLITDSRFGLTYSNKPVSKTGNYIFVKWDALELGGNIITAIKMLLGEKKNAEGHYTMFGLNYFQYAKSSVDFRYHHMLDVNNTIVYRVFAGAAIPYGNFGDFVPFEKRFFVGGVNSLRGWRPRSIGPGSYNASNQLDFSGEMKLELNTEFRFNIYNRWFEGAVFADGGNVWNVKPSSERPNGDFSTSRFYKELAIDAGAGFRLNFNVFIIRFDFALPLHDPRYAENERWVVKNFSGRWAFENLNFNFGIGYPF